MSEVNVTPSTIIWSSYIQMAIPPQVRTLAWTASWTSFWRELLEWCSMASNWFTISAEGCRRASKRGRPNSASMYSTPSSLHSVKVLSVSSASWWNLAEARIRECFRWWIRDRGWSLLVPSVQERHSRINILGTYYFGERELGIRSISSVLSRLWCMFFCLLFSGGTTGSL